MINQQIEVFLKSPAFAVVGASSNREKYGNKVLRCYLLNGKKVYPVNPHETLIESLPVVHSVNDLPDDVHSISIITPPSITEEIVKEAVKKGIQHIWMQPGAESDSAVQYGLAHKLNVISGGPCILVVMGYEES